MANHDYDLAIAAPPLFTNPRGSDRSPTATLLFLSSSSHGLDGYKKARDSGSARVRDRLGSKTNRTRAELQLILKRAEPEVVATRLG